MFGVVANTDKATRPRSSTLDTEQLDNSLSPARAQRLANLLENIMQNNTGFIKTTKTREQVYQGRAPRLEAQRQAQGL